MDESSMGEPLRSDPLVPHPDRLDPDNPMFAAIMGAHNDAVARGEAGYFDPGTGLFVMTAKHHVNRGKCCHNGCRHCPYVGARAR